ncbi:MAG: 4Fe-4S dicluster domain-containing protein [Acidimicrobiales bacterium]|nr:4Fe-4S dicluster domain-containing protein [Acidimicrobiales bacterium]
MDLKLDDDELNMCVQCGLCLPHCPTFRVTGEEAKSPRGRIHLMREVQLNGAPVTAEVLDSFETCVQCRGCEPACPSGVPYGHLMERTREALADHGLMAPLWQRLAMKPLAHPQVLGVGSKALAAAQRLRLVPKRLGISADVPFRQSPMTTSGTDVIMFTGCVMDAWQRTVHTAGQRVLEAAGFGVTPSGPMAPCCGALHAHAGLAGDTRSFAGSMINSFSTGPLADAPIVVDSAGCGAQMKDYGHLLGTSEAEAFSARVFDICEFLAQNLHKLPDGRQLPQTVAVQDPCHIRHVQRVHQATRDVLSRYVPNLVELDDDGLCCGAGGAYSVLQPELARQIRDRKVAAINAKKPDLVASANPGCSMHLGAVGVPTVHPMELVARALGFER